MATPPPYTRALKLICNNLQTLVRLTLITSLAALSLLNCSGNTGQTIIPDRPLPQLTIITVPQIQAQPTVEPVIPVSPLLPLKSTCSTVEKILFALFLHLDQVIIMHDMKEVKGVYSLKDLPVDNDHEDEEQEYSEPTVPQEPLTLSFSEVQQQCHSEIDMAITLATITPEDPDKDPKAKLTPKPDRYLAPGEIEFFHHYTKKTLRVQLYGSRGHMRPEALRSISYFFRSRRANRTKAIHPRLIALLYRVGQHFDKPIYLRSGFRPPKRGKKNKSRHVAGRAADFYLPGIKNEILRNFCKSHFERVGVGYYPNSIHVHLDVRKHQTYWIDYSRPGEKGKDYVLPVRLRPKRGSDPTLKSVHLTAEELEKEPILGKAVVVRGSHKKPRKGIRSAVTQRRIRAAKSKGNTRKSKRYRNRRVRRIKRR